MKFFILFTAAMVVFVVSIHAGKSTLTDTKFSACDQFFVDGKTPEGEMFHDGGLVGICQDKSETPSPVYASLYDKTRRIPVYSAYIVETGKAGKRPSFTVDASLLKKNDPQASDSDYSDNGKSLSRGHLAPNSYFDAGNSKITFTLTNAVPQYTEFNNEIWRYLEEAAKDITLSKCEDRSAFFITGAIPSTVSDDTMGANKVNIPTHMYTAACCTKEKEKGTKFSFGYIAPNIQYPSRDKIPDPEYLNVVVLAERIKALYKPKYQDKPVSFFDCNPSNTEYLDMLKSTVQPQIDAYRKKQPKQPKPPKNPKPPKPTKIKTSIL